MGGGGFGTSAAFFDYDKDGKLDLFVATTWTGRSRRTSSARSTARPSRYCTPESYKGQSPTLYRNRGDGTFEDVTAKAGLTNPASKALGVAVLDYDGDGWPDLFVANDTQPNKLYRNSGNGTFKDVGMAAGVAFSEAGVARAGMGVDAGDYDGSGRPSLVIGNFSNEMMALYHNEGTGLFIDEAPTSAIGQATLLTPHLRLLLLRLRPRRPARHLRRQRPRGRRHRGACRPKVALRAAAAPLPQPGRQALRAGRTRRSGAGLRSGRSWAAAPPTRDYDSDGDLDLVLTANNGPARLLRNDGGNQNHCLRVRTVGTRSNRDGIGARVTVTAAGRREAVGAW